MSVTSLNLDSEECLRFVGEGNGHLVFGFKDSDCVLRFRKFPPEDMILREEILLRVTSDLAFINDIARPLVGPLLVDKARLVSVDPCLLEKVMKRIRPLRDEKRFCKEINRIGIAIETPNVVTKFIDRRIDLEIHPKILNFSLTADVITIHSTIFPFSKQSIINSSDSIGNIGDALLDNTHNLQESSTKESQIITTLSHDESPAKPSESLVGVDPQLQSTIVDKTMDTDSKDNSEQEEEQREQQEEQQQQPRNEDKVCPNLRSEPSREEESQVKTNLEELDKESNLVYDLKDAPSRPHLVCIELKPKQGYPELGPKGNLLCRFCLKQYQKVETKTEEFRSSYCPRDLFSGNHSLMLKAIHNLFSAPQNNLKIFVDGKRVWSHNQYRHFSELILLILTYDPNVTGAKIKMKSVSPSSANLSETDSEISVPRDPHHSALFARPCAKRSEANGNSRVAAVAPLPPACYDAFDKVSRGTPKPVSGTPEISSEQSEKAPSIGGPEANPTLIPILPENSSLAPSSFLGKILYLQCLGRLPEVQAAILYREVEKRIPCEKELRQSLTDFKFLQNMGSISIPTQKSEETQKYTPDSPKETQSQQIPRSNLLYLGADEVFRGNIRDLDTASICQLIQECLIAMCAKDASLMMLIEGPYEKNKTLDSKTPSIASPFWLEFPSSSANWYKCQVSLVDVALKNPKKILDHERAMGKLEDILIKLKAEGTAPPCIEKLEKKEI